MGLHKLRSKEVVEAFYWEGSQDDEAARQWIIEVMKWDSDIYTVKNGIVERKSRFSTISVVDLNDEPYLIAYEIVDEAKLFNSFNAYSVSAMNMSYDLV